MREEYPYFRFGARNECVANVYDVKWEALPGTSGEKKLPAAGTIDALFHVQGHASRWPAVFPGDDPRIKFFSLPVAKRITESNLTGIELQPVQLRLGDLKGLQKRVGECPGYMWARVTGILLVDLFLNKNPWPLDQTGMFQLKSTPIGEYCDMKVRPEQPWAADFCRIVPGGTGYIAVSKKAAAFFDKLQLPEIIIGARGNGYL